MKTDNTQNAGVNYTVKLTSAQRRKIDVATRKLPVGAFYRLHDELDNGRTGKVYGVTLFRSEEEELGGGSGYVFRRDGQIFAQLYIADEPTEEQRRVALLLNRAAAALWGQQPVWSFLAE